MHDETKLREQLAYLAKIRGLKERKLRALYDRVFKGRIYYVRPAMDISREWIERRVFFAYCLANPCYEEGTPELMAFKRVARQVFLEDPELEKHPEQRKREHLKKRAFFSKRNIKRMSKEDVDAYLALLGITLAETVPLSYRRKCLWEYYNAKATHLPLMKAKSGKPKLAKRPRRENQFSLRELIISFPEMGWPEFREAFGDVMPTIERQSFYNARSQIRKRYGLNALPRLMPGARSHQLDNSYDHNKRIQARRVTNPESVILGTREFQDD